MLIFLTALINCCASLGAAIAVRAFVTTHLSLIGSFLGLEPTTNAGIAFGIDLGGGFQELLIILALGLVTFAAIRSAKTRWQQVAFGLIIGGGIGNVLDRLIHGSVTDFIQVGNFYIFNVADSCITVGAVLLLAEAFCIKYRKKA